MLRRLAALLLVLGLLAGCGEEAPGKGQATLWVTRNRGAEVMLNTSVPAGISAMEALRRKAEVETTYGGRYVQAIDGVEGSLGSQRDWFYYVNGYEADVGAADYELNDGDVVWFDYRGWADEMRVPVVVGAFPEPFVHGYRGKRRQVIVRAQPDSLARRLAKLVGGRVGGTTSGANVLVLVDGAGIRGSLDGTAGDPVTFYVGRDAARRLLREPSAVRFRYSVP